MTRRELHAGRFGGNCIAAEAIFHQQEGSRTAGDKAPGGHPRVDDRIVMGKILATLLIGLMLTAGGRAAGQPADGTPGVDPLEDGVAAYQRGDFASALRLFQRLAERGDASAQCNLGVMYEQGHGVVQNYREAMRWFRLAALQGDASAQSNVGVMYYKGQGIAQDYGEARKWYRMAAEQRNLEAQFNLGVMYEEGQGVAQDRVRAHMWFNLAAAISSDGNANLASKNRDIMTKSLTRSSSSEHRKWRINAKRAASRIATEGRIPPERPEARSLG